MGHGTNALYLSPQGEQMSDLLKLKHVIRTTEAGAEITVIDTGAMLSPEDMAMLQALHSRSSRGVHNHLELLSKRGSGSFMEQYYVGYGDKSIGDCGTTTIFIEGVSMLVAKAIQDSRLYNGQEASTRYIDFANQRFINPLGTPEGEVILERWREFYTRSMSQVVEHLSNQFPRQEGEDEKIYEKAIGARAFDILRGFLPAGASTNLAWHTNLRQASDKLMLLRHHPLEEVRKVAVAIEDALKEAHPSSFNHKRYDATEGYNEHWMSRYYFDPSGPFPHFELSRVDLDFDMLEEEYVVSMVNRPPKTELPKQIAEAGVVEFRFLLDFGSFRDVQRHRGVAQRMPLLTDKFGFEMWYQNELPHELRIEAVELLQKQRWEIDGLNAGAVTKQYYYAMGFNVPNRIVGDLAALVWLIELRATRFVHPTLRFRVRQMAQALQSNRKLKKLLALHLDTDPDRFDIKRGTQDIQLK